MYNIKHKKIKLSPHSRDKVGLYARDYNRDIYLENSIWDPSVFETKAYPEYEEKYAYFKFNQDQYASSETARDRELERLAAKEEARRRREKEIAEQLALEKARESEQPVPVISQIDLAAEKAAKKATATKKPTPPPPSKKNITKLSIEKRDKLNPIEELYYQALEEKGFENK